MTKKDVLDFLKSVQADVLSENTELSGVEINFGVDTTLSGLPKCITAKIKFAI
jgi:hypothetical protein